MPNPDPTVFDPDEIAERDQSWAEVNTKLDRLVAALADHARHCTSPSQFCMGLYDGDGDDLADAARVLLVDSATGPTAMWMLWAAAKRIAAAEDW